MKEPKYRKVKYLHVKKEVTEREQEEKELIELVDQTLDSGHKLLESLKALTKAVSEKHGKL